MLRLKSAKKQVAGMSVMIVMCSNCDCILGVVKE